MGLLVYKLCYIMNFLELVLQYIFMYKSELPKWYQYFCTK